MTPLVPLIIAGVIGVLVYLAGLTLLWSVVIALAVLVLLAGLNWGWGRG